MWSFLVTLPASVVRGDAISPALIVQQDEAKLLIGDYIPFVKLDIGWAKVRTKTEMEDRVRGREYLEVLVERRLVLCEFPSYQDLLELSDGGKRITALKETLESIDLRSLGGSRLRLEEEKDKLIATNRILVKEKEEIGRFAEQLINEQEDWKEKYRELNVRYEDLTKRVQELAASTEESAKNTDSTDLAQNDKAGSSTC